MKRKSGIGKFCVVVLVLCTMIIPASARYSSISYLSAKLSISDAGYASCVGTCTVEYGYTGEVTLELQQKKGSTWETIMDWNDSGESVRMDKRQFVAKGYDYRAKISADVYDSKGNFVEDGIIYSNIVDF